jgi:hypothetical protein
MNESQWSVVRGPLLEVAIARTDQQVTTANCQLTTDH